MRVLKKNPHILIDGVDQCKLLMEKILDTAICDQHDPEVQQCR